MYRLGNEYGTGGMIFGFFLENKVIITLTHMVAILLADIFYNQRDEEKPEKKEGNTRYYSQ